MCTEKAKRTEILLWQNQYTSIQVLTNQWLLATANPSSSQMSGAYFNNAFGKAFKSGKKIKGTKAFLLQHKN